MLSLWQKVCLAEIAIWIERTATMLICFEVAFCEIVSETHLVTLGLEINNKWISIPVRQQTYHGSQQNSEVGEIAIR